MQLSEASLAQLPRHVERPRYDRSQMQVGIVHLGVGNFHRAHQAIYTDKVLADEDLRWGICGVSLRSPHIKNLLQAQDNLYSVCVRDRDAHHVRIIGALGMLLCAAETPTIVLDRLAHSDTKIVTLTITEKGYHLPKEQVPSWDPATFSNVATPALLYLVEALWRRWRLGKPLFTIVSCDNLASNGTVLRSALIYLAAFKDNKFALYLQDQLKCPCTMVDRMVPKPDEPGVRFAQNQLGVSDKAAILTEPFSQWVIEDDFSQDRPDWERHGVIFSNDVSAYENMKLRMLNGAHTFLALLGKLEGVAYVNEVMGLGGVEAFLARFWTQTRKTIFIDQDLHLYQGQLQARFENSFLKHKTAQIVMDTSMKMPQRVIHPAMELARLKQDMRTHLFILALWFEFVQQSDVLDDPQAQKLKKAAGGDNIDTFMRQLDIFPSAFLANDHIQSGIKDALSAIRTRGALGAMRHYLN